MLVQTRWAGKGKGACLLRSGAVQLRSQRHRPPSSHSAPQGPRLTSSSCTCSGGSSSCGRSTTEGSMPVLHSYTVEFPLLCTYRSMGSTCSAGLRQSTAPEPHRRLGSQHSAAPTAWSKEHVLHWSTCVNTGGVPRKQYTWRGARGTEEVLLTCHTQTPRRPDTGRWPPPGTELPLLSQPAGLAGPSPGPEALFGHCLPRLREGRVRSHMVRDGNYQVRQNIQRLRKGETDPGRAQSNREEPASCSGVGPEESQPETVPLQ